MKYIVNKEDISRPTLKLNGWTQTEIINHYITHKQTRAKVSAAGGEKSDTISFYYIGLFNTKLYITILNI